jgi:hypothetical protein
MRNHAPLEIGKNRSYGDCDTDTDGGIFVQQPDLFVANRGHHHERVPRNQSIWQLSDVEQVAAAGGAEEYRERRPRINELWGGGKATVMLA